MEDFANVEKIRKTLHPEVLNVMETFNMNLNDVEIYNVVLAAMVRGITIFAREVRKEIKN